MHFDFYRLDDGGLVAHELAEASIEDNTVTVVEWGDVVSDVLPKDTIKVILSRQKDGEDKRLIKIHIPEGREYIGDNL